MRKRLFWAISLLATLALSASAALAQPLPKPTVKILVNRDGVNIRLLPAIGAPVLGFVNAGWTTDANGRSPDNEWVRIDFNGEEGWIGTAVLNFFGDINTLVVADPRTIPYGGFESPRSGSTDANSSIIGKLAQSGLRLRAGPSKAYPILANPLRFTVFPLLGRTSDNNWVQVNFNGTLGWVDAKWVAIQNGASILDLPIDGVVASAPPASGKTREEYIATLRLMLDRIDLAQPSLDSIRGTWTTVALGQRAACQNFPARPSDINIPNPLLAAFNPTLGPLQTDFNTAMANVRKAIDLWLEACGNPQHGSGVIGLATVQGALGVIQLADNQFADLRARISDLLPPLLEVGPNQCAFTFQGQSDVLQRISLGQVVRDSFDPSRSANGYCIDLNAGDTLRIELLRVGSGTAEPLVFVSPLDNPTNFIGTGRSIGGQNLLAIGPIIIPATGRYLIVVSDTSSQAAQSDYALLAVNVTGVTLIGSFLTLDPVTGQVIVSQQNASTPIPGVGPTVTPFGGGGGSATCPSLAFTCNQLFSCAEARACLAAGNKTLDPDNNGIPCQGPPLNCS
jgi:uncharacterized protein YraI